jgi:hypothetical protein
MGRIESERLSRPAGRARLDTSDRKRGACTSDFLNCARGGILWRGQKTRSPYLYDA